MGDANKRDEIITKKILIEIGDINKFIDKMTEEDFYNDVKTQKAVIMSLINIGELSKSFSDEFIAANDKIPWKKVQAMRNVAAHKYETVDMQIVWDTIKISIEELKKELQKLL
jgi:uncharacterized protein with HEPN domain